MLSPSVDSPEGSISGSPGDAPSTERKRWEVGNTTPAFRSSGSVTLSGAGGQTPPSGLATGLAGGTSPPPVVLPHSLGPTPTLRPARVRVKTTSPPAPPLHSGEASPGMKDALAAMNLRASDREESGGRAEAASDSPPRPSPDEPLHIPPTKPRVFLSSLGTRSEAEALAYVAAELQRRGCAVLLGTHEELAPVATLAGVPFVSLGSTSCEALAFMAAAVGGVRPSSSAEALGDVFFSRARAALSMFRPTFAVLSTLSLVWHASLCDSLGLPWAVAHASPLLPTSHAVPPLGLRLTPSRFLGSYNKAVWRLLNRLGWSLVFKDSVNRQRQSLGLPPITRASGVVGTYTTHAQPPRPTLLLYSPTLAGPAWPDWPATARLCGLPCHPLPPPNQLRPKLPPAMEAFFTLASKINADGEPGGPNLVVVVLGPAWGGCGGGASALALATAELLAKVANAVVAAGMHALMLTDHGAAPASSASADGADEAEGEVAPVSPRTLVARAGQVLRCASPHPPLRHIFARAGIAAVVCHGDPGVVHAATEQGLPCCVLPSDAGSDQAWWGGRLVELGACPLALEAGARLSPSKLSAALRRCGAERALRTRCEELGRTMGEERGAEAAAAYLMELAAGGQVVAA